MKKIKKSYSPVQIRRIKIHQLLIKKALQVLLLIFCWEAKAQEIEEWCTTPAESLYNDLGNIDLLELEDDSYTLRLYIHVIRRSDGTGGPPAKDIHRMVNEMQADFNRYGIFFYWNGSIDYIYSDYYFFDASFSSDFIRDQTLDGIHYYLFDYSLLPNAVTEGVGKPTVILAGSSDFEGFPNMPHIASHEMGHVLNLYHTHHGTVPKNDDDDNQCAELVDGSNSSICGDYISDTPADPGLLSENSYRVDENCNYDGSLGVDANGDAYSPDTGLIMSYSPDHCLSYFSDEQVKRMKISIETLPQLVDAVADPTLSENETYPLPSPTNFELWSVSSDGAIFGWTDVSYSRVNPSELKYWVSIEDTEIQAEAGDQQAEYQRPGNFYYSGGQREALLWVEDANGLTSAKQKLTVEFPFGLTTGTYVAGTAAGIGVTALVIRWLRNRSTTAEVANSLERVELIERPVNISEQAQLDHNEAIRMISRCRPDQDP